MELGRPYRMSPFLKLRRLQKSLFDKGTELLKQCEGISDPEAKKVALDAVGKYFAADVKIEADVKREPFAQTLLTLLGSYVVVVATTLWAYTHLSLLAAVGALLGSFVLL